MPFLRSLEVVDSSLELRSSKTLIGSAAATCDVVVTGDNVLELHALLNLAADKASAKLVPFSTTEAGVCYVNDVVVPREGAVVVHGDRVAFGHPRNVFLFELTPHPQMTAVSSAHSIETENSTQHSTASANRAFRKALDTLRGDRKTTTPTASVMASIQSNQPAARNRSIISSAGTSAPSVSKSKDPLSKFLLEASTDSLLSDYVERKLKQRQNGSKTRSSPASVASSSSVRQSREERNLAEVEKLRLSQRIREVNDVLNGDMEFRESCLSPSAKSVSKPHWRDGNNRKSIRTSIDENGDDDEEEDEDDDLPSMMEKHTSPLADRRPWTEVTHFEHYHVKLRTQTEQHVQQTTERLTSQHDQVQSSMRESHAQQLQKLMELIEEKDQELEKIKRQQRAEILDKAAAKMRWEKDLHSFFESAVVKCDEQIAEASDQLEGLLQRAEDDVLAARFGAAQFLVHCILQQKIFNANEYIRLHEAQLSKLPRGPSPPSLDPTDDLVSKLSSNGRFLYDMIQQRLTRLQQLHQSLAKLAAVSDVCSGSLDPERLRHSSFLADALLQRQQSHLLLVIARFRP
ncbi:hypothetical protein PF010_g21144 [Phytophthora fragariae]|uniref:FHA domain-containing protein n=1 Tax=Phytophthora fragariae TaxID=53985 RepID=A0A6A3IXF5_9STRA|nr:hypothetical protein PF011_g20593 [Phytophthora fragariae]KAE9083617.1 hypothetical protein PF010_g21144 [Phytophthora fragariae]